VPVPQPVGGVVIIGEQTMSYCDGAKLRACAMPPAAVTAVGAIDGSRFLIGDAGGVLSSVVVVRSTLRLFLASA
jgi:DNA damage-binding protein 1